MKHLRNRHGFTLLEIIIAVFLLSIVLIGTTSLLTNMLRMWSTGSSGTSSNMYAGIGMRRLVKDIEEAKSASLVNGNLRVVFPYVSTSTGDYVRTATGKVYTYYISGSTGSETSGNYLWRTTGSGVKTKIASNINSVTYTLSGNNLIRITMIGRDDVGGAVNPNMVQQSVMLRNN